MKIAAMLLADAANETSDGRINLLGVGVTIWRSRNYPARGSIVVYLRLVILSTEVGQHTVALDLITADGKNVIPRIQGQFAVPQGVPMYGYLNLIYNLGFEIPVPGEYSFRAIIDTREEADCPVTAVLESSTAPPGQTPGS